MIIPEHGQLFIPIPPPESCHMLKLIASTERKREHVLTSPQNSLQIFNGCFVQCHTRTNLALLFVCACLPKKPQTSQALF